MHANTSTVSHFADCPRCGGWARRIAEASARWHCRGCQWKGVVGP